MANTRVRNTSSPLSPSCRTRLTQSSVFLSSGVIEESPNLKQAKVLIHHPSYGSAPADWRDKLGRSRRGSRAEYRAHQFGLVPRPI